MYGDSDSPTRKTKMAALKFLSADRIGYIFTLICSKVLRKKIGCHFKEVEVTKTPVNPTSVHLRKRLIARHGKCDKRHFG